MKLYFSPGSCSLAPHIALREAGIDFDAVKVDMRTRTTSDGSDYRSINPNGYVPALQLDNGEILTEGPAILQYIADQKPAANLAPAAGSMPRYRMLEWLNYITSELHKGFGPLLRPGGHDDVRAQAKERLEGRIGAAAERLGDREFCLGSQFSIVDCYLSTVLGWTKPAGIDLAQWPSLVAYRERILKRPAVRAAREAEGLKT